MTNIANNSMEQIKSTLETSTLSDGIVELAEIHNILISSQRMEQDGELKFLFILNDLDKHHTEYIMENKSSHHRSHAKFESYRTGLETTLEYAKKYVEKGRKPYAYLN